CNLPHWRRGTLYPARSGPQQARLFPCAAVSLLLLLHYGGLQVRSSLICAITVCTLCEHAQPKWAKSSSHTTLAPAPEDSPRRRIVRWLSAYFLVPNWRSRSQSSITPPS